MSSDYAIFVAAEANDVKTLKRLLDGGMDPNVKDYDREATPLHWAANKGHVEAIELLIDSGANVNAQNKRGRTPIHALIEMKFYKIVLWLIKYCGGDPFIEDVRGLRPYDLAQGFMQKEIDECLASIGQGDPSKKEETYIANPATSSKASTTSTTSTESSSASSDDYKVFKVYLPNRSYKSVKCGKYDTAEILCESLCDKMQLSPELGKNIVLFERVKDRERRVKPTENIFDIQKMWPLILGSTGNETNRHCYFLAAPLSTAPEAVKKAMS